jgi:hypothetical protein
MSSTFLVSSPRNKIPAFGERIFLNTAGIISWTVPAGITSISIVVVGGGGGGGGTAWNFSTGIYSTGAGGGGGGLAYVTDIAVTPGEILEITVGIGGGGGSNFITGGAAGTNIGTASTAGTTGGSSWVRRQGSGTFIVSATGGGGGARGAFIAAGGIGGSRVIGEGGGDGGSGGSGSLDNNQQKTGAGGGGAGGYDNAGGAGAMSFQSGLNSQQGSPGNGGGGAGGNSVAGTLSSQSGGYGGGVGIYGGRLDGSPPTATNSPVTETGPGSTINISNPQIVGNVTSVGAITYNPLGVSGLSSSTTPSSGNNDDGNWGFTLPWNIWFLGVQYSQVFLGTNSYLTFNSGSNVFSGLSSSNPALPKIMISAADNSVQRVYFGTVGTAPNRIYIIRAEGTASSSGALGSPNMLIEYQFYEAITNQIDFHVVLNARQPAGISGIYNSNGTESYTSIGIAAGSATRLISSTGPFTFVPAVINNQYIYAGGGAGAYSVGPFTGVIPLNANQGRDGAVRIIWPGSTRRFPDQNVAPINA